MIVDDPYATGLLHKEHHSRLVANLTNFAKDAGIQRHWVWTPIESFCSDEEQTYVNTFKRHASYGVGGLCYVGMEGLEVRNRMSAITGKLVRNFIRARMMTLGTVLDTIAQEGSVTATCLLIPNFFIAKDQGGSIATWQVQTLFDMLMQRQADGQQTVIGVTDKGLLGKEYGRPLTELLDAAYRIIQA